MRLTFKPMPPSLKNLKLGSRVVFSGEEYVIRGSTSKFVLISPSSNPTAPPLMIKYNEIQPVVEVRDDST